jgi:hypothetical protein
MVEAITEKPIEGWPPNTEWFGTWYLLTGDSFYRKIS